MKIIKNKNNIKFLKFRDICTVQQGLQIKQDERYNYQIKNSLPYITIQNLKQESFSEFILSPRASVVCHNNDILVARTGSVGKIVKNVTGVFHNNFFKLNLKEEFNSEYIYHVLTGRKSQFDMKRLAGITTIPDLKHSDFFILNILDLERKQQEKIASVLSQQEEQVNKIKTLIEKLEKRNQYYAERLLSGELRVREGADGEIEFYDNEEWKEIKVGNKTKLIPVTWDKDVLGDLASVTTGKKNANAGSEEGLYKFFTCSKEDKLINSYSFDQEAILIAGNGIVGLSKYYNGKFDAYQRTYVLGDFKINGKYLFSFINRKFQKAIEKEIKGGVISYIKLENINDFEILYPNNNSELELLMASLKNLNTELSQAKQLFEKEQKRFDWMSDALLSGEYQIID